MVYSGELPHLLCRTHFSIADLRFLEFFKIIRDNNFVFSSALLQNNRSPTICARGVTVTSRIRRRRSATCSTTASRARARKSSVPTDYTSTSTRGRARGQRPPAAPDAANRTRVSQTNLIHS